MPYLTRELSAEKAYDEARYDVIPIPAELDSIPPKEAIRLIKTARPPGSAPGGRVCRFFSLVF